MRMDAERIIVYEVSGFKIEIYKDKNRMMKAIIERGIANRIEVDIESYKVEHTIGGYSIELGVFGENIKLTFKDTYVQEV